MNTTNPLQAIIEFWAIIWDPRGMINAVLEFHETAFPETAEAAKAADAKRRGDSKS